MLVGRSEYSNTTRVRASVRAITQKVSHAPIAIRDIALKNHRARKAWQILPATSLTRLVNARILSRMASLIVLNRPISVYGFPHRALTLCPQLCMGIQPGARFHVRSADALPATLYGHFTQAVYRNRPNTPPAQSVCMSCTTWESSFVIMRERPPSREGLTLLQFPAQHKHFLG